MGVSAPRDLARLAVAINHDLNRRRSISQTSITEAAVLIPA